MFTRYLLGYSHQRCSIKKDVLKNFVKFTEKHLCKSLFFNKAGGLRPAIVIKKRTLMQVFFCEFCEIFKNTFFIEHLRTSTSAITANNVLRYSCYFTFLPYRFNCWILLVEFKIIKPTQH